MVSRGQGAMEYLMSYGWAILVIAVVGIVLWRIDVFDFGGSAPTSGGFQELKPVLASCEISGRKAWEGISPFCFSPFNCPIGFSCQFTNAAGTPIEITDLNVTVNGEYCGHLYVSDNFLGGGRWFERLCFPNPPPNCWGFIYREDLSVCTIGFNEEKCFIDFPASSNFMVGTAPATINFIAPFTGTLCNNLQVGESYDVLVDISYQVDVGGITSERHSTGTIRLKAS